MQRCAAPYSVNPPTHRKAAPMTDFDPARNQRRRHRADGADVLCACARRRGDRPDLRPRGSRLGTSHRADHRFLVVDAAQDRALRRAADAAASGARARGRSISTAGSRCLKPPPTSCSRRRWRRSSSSAPAASPTVSRWGSRRPRARSRRRGTACSYAFSSLSWVCVSKSRSVVAFVQLARQDRRWRG